MFTFKELLIGQSFDWIDELNTNNQFRLRCRKISPHRYEDSLGRIYRVSSKKVRVFHVARIRQVRRQAAPRDAFAAPPKRLPGEAAYRAAGCQAWPFGSDLRSPFGT
jgi:hypothetical protein